MLANLDKAKCVEDNENWQPIETTALHRRPQRMIKLAVPPCWTLCCTTRWKWWGFHSETMQWIWSIAAPNMKCKDTAVAQLQMTSDHSFTYSQGTKNPTEQWKYTKQKLCGGSLLCPMSNFWCKNMQTSYIEGTTIARLCLNGPRPGFLENSFNWGKCGIL